MAILREQLGGMEIIRIFSIHIVQEAFLSHLYMDDSIRIRLNSGNL